MICDRCDNKAVVGMYLIDTAEGLRLCRDCLYDALIVLAEEAENETE